MKDAEACEMRADACVKWRFQRSTDVVSLRDESKIRDSVASCCRASSRDAVPSAFRLPRRCAPRNDTELERFYLDNGRFTFFAVIFCAVLLCTVFQTFRSGNCSVFKRFVPENAPFSRKTHQICHCEEGAALAPDAAIFDGTICHPGTRHGKAAQ